MKKYFSVKNIVMFIVSIVILLFVYNDHFLYQVPIMKIDKINTKLISGSDYEEKNYSQEISGTIKNGKYKGKQVTIKNVTSTSGVYDEQIKGNSEIFLSTKDGNNFSFDGIKRDKYIAI